MAKKNKWLFESSFVPFDSVDVKVGLKIKKRLYSGRSPFQKIEVFDTYTFGRVLVLDGIFQTSEKDEFVYHEMICHLPMFYHKNPQKTLIIGGGDGGALEEVLKHPIERVWMMEIDKKVIEVSQKYLPAISQGAFNFKKAEVIVGDGHKLIKNYRNFFDVIILDLSDPWGPAEKLISTSFYRNVKKSMKKDGVVSVQSGSLRSQLDLVLMISKRLKKVFSSVKIHRAPVALYGTGDFSFTLAANINLEKPDLSKIKRRFKKLSSRVKYYSPEIHQSSGILPKYLKNLFIP
jgi:spermidine synthase